MDNVGQVGSSGQVGARGSRVRAASPAAVTSLKLTILFDVKVRTQGMGLYEDVKIIIEASLAVK
jgi:hypothetical protein